MDKDGIKQVTLKEVDYDSMDEQLFIDLNDLYLNCHSTPKEFLKEKLPYANYLVVFNHCNDMIGMTSYREISKKLVITERTILLPSFRGIGFGSAICLELEKFLKKREYNKMCCEILTFNLPMLFIKLKQGYLVEGLARNHDGKDVHQYYLGKEI